MTMVFVSFTIILWLGKLTYLWKQLHHLSSPPCLLSHRYLSDEGIAELKGSAEKITPNDIIRIALNVSLILQVLHMQLISTAIA